MCGIVGALEFHNGTRGISEAYINQMRDTMVHRGPDGAGTWVSEDRKIGLGHRRLAIIDLSDAALQPMSNEDGSLRLSYNGEIYNHAEIRKELEKTGRHRWKTDHSDTEVILHAFEEWGIDCLERFRGMFAFALWDGRRRELWLARDRIGIKPLYYSIHDGRITFGSEIKALLADNNQRREVDREALFHYLSFATTPAPYTLFAGIRKVPGGMWLRIRENGDIYEHRYWDVWNSNTSLDGVGEKEIAQRVLEELREAVRLRKVGDVPVGVFLSGGIDSSTNAALFSQGETEPINTFTIGYEGEYTSYSNEMSYARLMAGNVGAKYREKLLNLDDLLEFVPRMVYLQDEPIADPVCVPVYYVSKLARDSGVTVCQVGEGADELFWGYPGWKEMLYLQRLYDMPFAWIAKALGVAGLRVLKKQESSHYERLSRTLHGQPIFWSGYSGFTELQKRQLLSERARRQFRGQTSWTALAPIYERFRQKRPQNARLDWMSYVDLNLRLPELLLMRVDKMSMAESLECRVPFLDHKFVELAMQIPESVKTRNGNLKHVLKRSVRGVIPDQLIDRKKQGFGVPVHEWFADRLGKTMRNTLRELCRQTDYFDSEYVERLASRGAAPQFWFLYNFAVWWETFIR